MQIYDQNQIKQIAAAIRRGEAVVLPTDTIYGLCASALNQKAVEKIYQLRRRDKNKPCIILIADIAQLQNFKIKLTSDLKNLLSAIWPNRISVVLRYQSKNFSYLHRQIKTLSFRVPNSKFISRLLELTGPLIAPSANIQNRKPAKNLKEAQRYFHDQVSYVDGGVIKGKPSSLIAFDKNFDLKILRAGATNGNHYYLMRHGEAISNAQDRLSSYPEKFRNPLTVRGQAQVTAQLRKIKNLTFHFIIASPLERTKQTAKMVNQVLKLPLRFDLRLREMDFGVLNGQPTLAYQSMFKNDPEKYLKAAPGGETRRQVKLRMLQVFFEIEKKHKRKNILIISHQDPIWVVAGASQGLSEKETANKQNLIFNLAQLQRVKFLDIS